MGGNAFEAAQRLPADVYRDLKWSFGLDGFLIPLSYYDKVDHGDVDIIVEDDSEALRFIDLHESNIVDRIKTPSGYNLLYRYEHKGVTYHVQVDLNFVGKGNMHFAHGYFSYNDLGNLIGRIAHRQGLKFGHDGLSYVYRDGTRVLGEFFLTKDFGEALEYLGFDSDWWYSGFDTLEEIFMFVVNSDYFEACAFPLEHRNHKARTRDAKRKNYAAFLEYINFSGEYVPSDKEKWLKKHTAHFPHLAEQMEAADASARRSRDYKALFGGNVVSEVTGGLQGKELGIFMTKMKEAYPLNDETLSMTPEEARNAIKSFYENS